MKLGRRASSETALANEKLGNRLARANLGDDPGQQRRWIRKEARHAPLSSDQHCTGLSQLTKLRSKLMICRS
jgi:hypothetical protein